MKTQSTTPNLRIAFIGGRGVISKYSGIETYYEEVGSRLAAMGHKVTAYCRSYFTPEVRNHRGVRIVRLPTIRSRSLETLFHTFLSTLHVLRSDCDIVHYHCLGPALFSFLPRLFGKKTVVTVQGLDWQRKKWGRIASAVLRAGEWAGVRFPNTTIVVSETLQRHYLGRYGADTTYVPNGSTLRGKSPASHLSKWGLTPGGYILFLGRFSPEKNCHLLIDAYEKIETQVKLVLAGGSSHSNEYVRRLRQRQNERIRLLDWQSGKALDELLTNAMLFVLPSDLEGMSLALLDALGAGVCTLASDVPENRETLGGAGFTFRVGDVDDLEGMLRLLLSSESRRAKAAIRGKKRVQQCFLWDQIAKQMDSVYRQLWNGRQSISSETDNLISNPRAA
ncbi:MAG TPA: glycosyltransferase family 4 protein [Terriglobales bacterium]|nr:glycosyltransferase family 4 protein [Terriglobales bacterium]